MEKSRTFQKHFNLSEEDLSYLWNLFLAHGMTHGEAVDRSKGNHYFLQGICQYYSVEWETWNKKLTKAVRDVIETKYPQLMVQNKEFEKS